MEYDRGEKIAENILIAHRQGRLTTQNIEAMIRKLIAAGFNPPRSTGEEEIQAEQWVLQLGPKSHLWVPEKREWFNLPPTRASVMKILMENAGNPIPNLTIKNFIGTRGYSNNVAVHVNALRVFTEQNPRRPKHIVTYYGQDAYGFHP